MDNIKEISKIINKINDDKVLYNFLLEMLSDAEVSDLSKRWRILKMLYEGRSQRDIAKELKVSLCKITRGAKIIKNQNSVITKILRKENTNE